MTRTTTCSRPPVARRRVRADAHSARPGLAEADAVRSLQSGPHTRAVLMQAPPPRRLD